MVLSKHPLLTDPTNDGRSENLKAPTVFQTDTQCTNLLSQTIHDKGKTMVEIHGWNKEEDTNIILGASYPEQNIQNIYGQSIGILNFNGVPESPLTFPQIPSSCEGRDIKFIDVDQEMLL